MSGKVFLAWPYPAFPAHFQSLGPVNSMLKFLEISHLTLNIFPGHPNNSGIP